MLITGEDTCRHWLSAGCCFHERIDRFIEAPWDVIEFEAFKFDLQPSDFLIVRSRPGVVTARLLHDLVDDQLRVTLDVEALDAQLDGNA